MSVAVPCVLFKPSVRLLATPALARLLWAVQQTVNRYGRSLTVSCGIENHTTGAHVTGEAIDLSVSGLTPMEMVDTCDHLVALLGPLFYAQLEAPDSMSDIMYPPFHARLQVNPVATALHIHLQRRAGTVYPPPA